jgi:hypothetical protein
MKLTEAIPKIPARLQRKLTRKAAANHRSLQGEILHRLETSLEHEAAEEELAAHLQRALKAQQVPMQPDEVIGWAEETLKSRERRARQK